MFELRMNIWWENIVQLGIPLLIVLIPIAVAVVLVRKENKKKDWSPNSFVQQLISLFGNK